MIGNKGGNMIITTEEFKSNIEQFIGTNNHYASWLMKYRYTDGVRYFAQEAGAYWLLNEINFIYVDLARKGKAEFLNIVVKCKNKKADILVDDGNGNLLKKKHISWTDLPEGEWQFYLYDNTLLLPSEN